MNGGDVFKENTMMEHKERQEEIVREVPTWWVDALNAEVAHVILADPKGYSGPALQWAKQEMARSNEAPKGREQSGIARVAKEGL